MKYYLISNKNIEIDKKRIVNHIIARSRISDKIDSTELLEKLQIELNTVNDYIDICSGHDICRVLAIALSNFIGNCNKFRGKEGRNELERVLRLAYSWDDFVNTCIYHRLICWQKRNKQFYIFNT